MKKNYTFIVLLFIIFGYAQPPTNYYNNATGLGYTLKTQLKTIITNGHSDQGYGSLWSAYATTDRDFGIGYENDNSIVDMYSENPSGTDPYIFIYDTNQCGSYASEGDCYNREHLVPQAYWENVNVNPMKNDPHHVIPTDGKVNGVRDNFPFGKVNIASFTSQNGSKKGSNLNSGYSAGYTGIVFEPIDEFKGDIARCLFYFATRYENQMAQFYSSASVQSKDMFDGSINQVFSATFLNILLQWNNDDPVSIKEVKRNNAIYAYQGNRNPYIDDNTYVTKIWGSPLATTTFDILANVTIYPNPANDHKISIESELPLDEIQLININGQILQEIKKPIAQYHTYTLENLQKGFYFVKLSADNQNTFRKVIVN